MDLKALGGKLTGLKKQLAQGLKRRPSHRTVIALDGEWLKIFQVTATPGSRAVRRIAAVQIKDWTDPQAVLHQINQAAGEAHFDPGITTLCIPSQLTITRLLTLPSSDPAEIAQMVQLQVEQHTPYAKEEVISDFQLMEQDEKGYSRVLLVLAHQDVVQKAVAAIQGLGWTVDKVGSELEGLLHWFRLTHGLKGGASATVLLLDVDLESTTLLILQGSKPIFHRSVAVGLNRLSADPAAEMTNLLGELQRSLDALETEGVSLALSELVLTGQAARVDGLAETLGQGLKVAGRVLSSWEKCHLSSALQERAKTLGISFSGLIGLAAGLVRLDLTPRAIRLRQTFERRARAWVTLGGQIMGLLLLLTCLGVEKTVKINHLHAELSSQNNEISKEAGAVGRKLDQIRLIREILTERGTLLDITSNLSQVLPPEIQLRVLTYNAGEGLLIKGISAELPKVYELVSALGKDPMFKEVTARRVSRRKVEGKDVTDFEISCTFKGAG